MKILLFGEFSGLFNCLRDGLVELGHDVTRVSNGDGRRRFPADFDYYFSPDKYGKRFHRILEYGKLYSNIHWLGGYDVVLVVNPIHLSTRPFINNPINNYLFKNNGKVFMSGSGMAPISYNYWFNSNEKYKKYVEGEINDMPSFQRFIGNEDLVRWESDLMDRINGYIPIWYEYAKPYKQYPRCLKSIRIPINYNKQIYQPNKVKDKIVFFASISPRKNAKGFPFIKAAFEIMKKKYGTQAEFIAAGGLPFNEYMELISRTNVVLDDANSCSVAMNGLFSLCQGKIVMGGAEPYANKELGLDWNPVYNLCPDVDQICSCIEDVIQRKEEIEELGYKSRQFVEQYHDYRDIAKQYIEIFEKY